MKDKSTEKPDFTLPKDIRAVFRKLQPYPDQFIALQMAILDYENDGLLPEWANECSAIGIAFTSYKLYADRAHLAYNKRCESNRANGQQGGLAKARAANES